MLARRLGVKPKDVIYTIHELHKEGLKMYGEGDHIPKSDAQVGISLKEYRAGTLQVKILPSESYSRSRYELPLVVFTFSCVSD